MDVIYESSRDKKKKKKGMDAILEGLSSDGGLYVLHNLKSKRYPMKSLCKQNYCEICETLLSLFFSEFDEVEIADMVHQAYANKFDTDEITPLVTLHDAYVVELFHGPTSAFKDIGLSVLPQLVCKALEKKQKPEKLLFLVATSGDTGMAALQGFKDVQHTNVIVFYPKAKTSLIQERQMRSAFADNVRVCAVEGNFDDAQTGIKKLFQDEDFKERLNAKKQTMAFANSVNIGRLLPQLVYYFDAYAKLLRRGEIQENEAVNFVVPTGNFGNILAGYYAKQLGLPIHKLICATNENNVLCDFFKTGEYDSNREFIKTNSPSMDILVSSNVERLLYYASNQNHMYVKKCMMDLKQMGCYKIEPEVLANMQKDFLWGCANDQETLDTIQKVYENERYVLDPHTATAYKVLLENKDPQHKSIVLATASPYKFAHDVLKAIAPLQSIQDEFEAMEYLYKKTKIPIPNNLQNLKLKPLRFYDVIQKEEMKAYILKVVEEF
ncbi:MAG: threonine synthase [Breznakia sp.]